MATITVADSADGTGAVATISGSSGGANAVHAQNVDGQLGSSTWALAGSRTGDGTVALALAKGYYWAYCLTGGSAVSGLAYFQVTDGLDAVIDRAYDAVKATLQLLALPCTVDGDGASRVYDTQYADPVTVLYPCTVITTEDARQTNESALNGRDDVGHPVRILIKDVCLRYDDRQKRTYRKWRQAIYRAFHNQRLAGLAETLHNKVEYGPISLVKTAAPQLVTELTVRAITREVRGFGT